MRLLPAIALCLFAGAAVAQDFDYGIRDDRPFALSEPEPDPYQTENDYLAPYSGFQRREPDADFMAPGGYRFGDGYLTEDGAIINRQTGRPEGRYAPY